jgi:hypothetical protein
MLTRAEVAKHSTVDDLWVIIVGQAYDLSQSFPFCQRRPSTHRRSRWKQLPLLQNTRKFAEDARDPRN